MFGISKLFGNQKSRRFASIFAVSGVIFTLIAAALISSLDWHYISDEQKASRFEPSAEISAIADELQLTRRGRAAFYAAQPELQDDATFNANCGNDGEATYMLGCYAGGENERIHLYDLDADALDENGIHYDFAAERSTTALHEFLHAVYVRLDSREQQNVCRAAKSFVAQKPELGEALGYYSDAQYCTEAFARIGSEYSDQVSGILAKTYSKYFTPNEDLLARHQQNEAELAALNERTTKTHEKLSAAKSRLDNQIAAYRVSLTRRGYRAVNAQIADYNTMVADYNSLVATYKKIVRTLDSESRTASIGK